jgi:autotransporter translocation and assembly factor TamB
MKQLFIGSGIFLGVMVALVAGVFIYFHTQHGQRLIQAKVNEMIPGTISYDNLRYSLLGGRFELTNVVVKGPYEDNLVGFERLSIDLSWIPLLRRNLVVAALVLEKPWANIQVDREGEINLMRAFSPPKSEDEKPGVGKGPGMPFNIVVRSLKVVRGHLRYETDLEDLEIVVQEVNITANGNLSKQSGNLTLQTGKASLERPGINTELDHVKLEATLMEGGIDSIHLQANTGESELRLSGNVDDVFRKPYADFVLDLAVSLAQVQRSLQLEPALTGEVRGHLAARGTLDNPEVTFDLDYGGGNVAGIRINGIALNCSMKDRLVLLHSLRAKAGSGELSVHGKADLRNAFSHGFLAPKRDVEAISYEFVLEQKGMKLEQMLVGASKLSGTMYSEGSVRGRGVSPKSLSTKIALDILAKQVGAGKVGGPMDVHVKTAGSLDKGIATLQHLEAEARDIQLHAEGLFDLFSRAFKGQLSLKAPNLADTLPSFGLDRTYGALDVEADLSGSIEQPQFDCRLQGDQLRFQDIIVGDVLLHVSLEQSGMLRLSQLSLDNQGSSIHGGGSIKVFAGPSVVDPTLPLRFSLALKDVEAKDFIGNGLASGTVNGQLDIDGSRKALHGSLSLRGRELSIKAARFGDLDVDLQLSEGALSLDRVKLHNQKSDLHISGTAQVLDQKTMQPLQDPRFHLDVEGSTLFIEDFVDQLKGRVSLAARLDGSLTKPQGSVHLEGKDLDLGVQKFEAFNLVSRLNGEKIWIDPLEIVVASGELIEGKGWFSFQKAYDISLATKGVSLHHVDWVRDQRIADGKILFDIAAKGTSENPEITGDITLCQTQINGKPLDDCRIRVDLQDQLARISARLDFDLNGTFHLQKKDFSASILFADTHLAPYFKVAGQGDLGGTLTGRIEAKGNAGDLDRIQAYVDLPRLDLFSGEKELVQARDLKVSLKEGEASTPGFHLVLLKEGWLDVAGRMRRNGPLGLQVKGNIPLRVASLFTEDLPDATGDIVLSGTVAGTQVHPDLRFEIGLQDIAFTVPALVQKIHGLNGRIQISPTAVTVDQIEGQLDTGRFNIAGQVDLEALQPAKVNIKLSANALPLQVPDTMDLLLNAELQLRGTREKSVMEGQAIILEGSYYRDVNLSLLQTVEKKREESAPAAEMDHPFLKNTGLDVSIKSQNPFVVENNLATLDVDPDLRITGKLNHPIIMGRAQVTSGTINYRRKDFVVKKGLLDFLNPYKTEPAIDVESEVKVRHWTILLAISGTPDALTFKLTSNPSESDGDILSLLAIGRTTSELIDGEGGASKSTSQMLAEMIATRFGEDIQQATGLDIFEVETGGENGEDSSDQTKVTIGKELSRRMLVKYAVETKNSEMIQRAISEYRLLENFSLRGFQDTKGIFGGELQFRLEFR